MHKNFLLKGLSLSKQISFTAVFAALCCVSTLTLTIPLPTSGYFNTGDVFVLLSSWFLGPLFGSIAAALGSSLADLFSGFVFYAPVTFIIKAFMAFISYLVWAFLKKCIKKEKLDAFTRVLSAVVGECIMVVGYFLFELTLYGLAGASANLIGNCIQGVCCLSLASVLCSALYPIKTIKNYFPFLVYTPSHA